MYDHYFSTFGRPPQWFLQRFNHKASLVMKKKIFKGFYHIWAKCQIGQWTATILAILHSPAPGRLQMKFEQQWPRGSRGGHLKFSIFFPYKCIGKQTWPHRKKVKCQCMTTILASLVDLLSPIIFAKIQPQGIPGSGEKDFFKAFYHIWHGGHLGQWTATILANFHSLALVRLQMKFEQHWPRGSFVGHLKFSTFFPYKCIGKKTWPHHKKVKCQCMTINLAIW